MAVKIEGRGLQEEEAVALNNILVVSATCLSRPHHQEEQGLLVLLPPMVCCLVVVTLWPSAGQVHIALECRRRGFKDKLLEEFLAVVRDLRAANEPARYPPWMRDWGIMTSHRSNLLRKEPDWYNQFGWLVKPDLPYKWPVPGSALEGKD